MHSTSFRQTRRTPIYRSIPQSGDCTGGINGRGPLAPGMFPDLVPRECPCASPREICVYLCCTMHCIDRMRLDRALRVTIPALGSPDANWRCGA